MKRKRITADSYKLYCLTLRNLLNIAEEEHYVCKFNSMGGDMKKNWKTLNTLLGKNRKCLHDEFLIDDEKTKAKKKIANAFSDYFVEYPKSIHDGIPSTIHDFSTIIPYNYNTIIFYFSTVPEVLNIVDNMKKEGCIDDIPLKFLKLSRNFLAKYISELF